MYGFNFWKGGVRNGILIRWRPGDPRFPSPEDKVRTKVSCDRVEQVPVLTFGMKALYDRDHPWDWREVYDPREAVRKTA